MSHGPAAALSLPVTVATLNIHGVKQAWWRRRGIVLAELTRLAPDVLALQEAARFVPQARALAKHLSRVTGRPYRVVSARKRGWRGLIEGLAVITHLTIAAVDVIDLRGDARVAQRLRLTVPGGTQFDLYNLHLASGGDRGALRESQLSVVLGVIESHPGVPAVIAGDLNATPDSRSLRLLEPRFRSACVLAHGAEPSFTAPADSAPGQGWVLDYVFVSEGSDVLSCDLAFGPVLRDDRLKYPSDHLGLVATVRVIPRR